VTAAVCRGQDGVVDRLAEAANARTAAAAVAIQAHVRGRAARGHYLAVRGAAAAAIQVETTSAGARLGKGAPPRSPGPHAGRRAHGQASYRGWRARELVGRRRRAAQKVCLRHRLRLRQHLLCPHATPALGGEAQLFLARRIYSCLL
jgi:hypothetical protein